MTMARAAEKLDPPHFVQNYSAEDETETLKTTRPTHLSA